NLGDTLPNGQNRHSYGISVLVPSFRSFAANESDGTATYRRRVTDRELWTGAGYGLRLTPTFSIGISGFYILRTVTDSEGLTANESLTEESDRFQVVSNDISLVNGNVLLVAGANWRPDPRLRLGLSIRSPSLALHSEGNLFFEQAEADPSGGEAVSTFDRQVIEGRKSETRFAPSARLGAAWVEPNWFTVSADVSVHAPVSYTLIDVDVADVRQRLPFSAEVERQWVANYNVGAEFLIIRDVSIAAGAFSNFSSAPRVDENPQSDQLPDVDLFGYSFSLGYFGEYTLSRLGAIFSFGTGDDVLPESDIARLADGDLSFRRVDYSQSFFYVFLSSTFRY
ncbi:MAG: hypothetical protein AAFX94_14070, partial [Myxococcota bacterium]